MTQAAYLVLRPVLAVLCLLSLAPLAGAIGVGLQPTTVEVTLKPGERQRQTINIANVHQEKTISLTIGLADWSLDEFGEIVLAAPGDLDRSGTGWVQFSPGFVTLEPGESEQIIVDMTAPARVKEAGDHRFALLASTILPDERANGSGVWRRYQLATLFYMTAGEAESQPAVVASGVVVDGDGGAVVDLAIDNPGNAHARLNGTIEITDGDKVLSQDLGNVVVLDRGKRFMEIPLKDPVASGATVTLRMTNTFVPQIDSGVLEMDPVVMTAALVPVEAEASAPDTETALLSGDTAAGGQP